MEHHLTATLAQLRTENRDKMALIKQLEDEITRQKSKMAAVVDNLKVRVALCGGRVVLRPSCVEAE